MTDAELRELLDETKMIAVVGLSNRPQRPSYHVADYLREQGYLLDGNSSLSMNVKQKSSYLLREEAGLKIAKTFDFNYGRFTPDLSVGYINKTPFKSYTNATLVAQPGSFRVRNYVGNTHRFATGVGMTIENNLGTFASVRFDSEYGSSYQAFEVSLRLGLSF